MGAAASLAGAAGAAVIGAGGEALMSAAGGVAGVAISLAGALAEVSVCDPVEAGAPEARICWRVAPGSRSLRKTGGSPAS